MMKILIDFTQIPTNKVGVGVYALQTFRRIFAQDSCNYYYCIVQNDDVDFLQFKYANVKLIKVNSKIFRNFVFRTLLEHFYIPFLKLRYNIEIIHSLHYSFPLFSFGAKRIVTIHDMTFYLYPKLHTSIKRYYFKFFVGLSTKAAYKLITVSQSTSKDLIKQYPKISQKKICCIPLACEIPASINPSQYCGPYITFIGTIEPRKNIEKLINAFSCLINDYKFSHYKLVIVGKKGWFYDSVFEVVDKLKISNKVIFTGFVSDADKFAILKSSDLFVYPSYYEGFGLPVLEAISLNIPTITSNISSMPEVAGDAAILIDPNNVEDITRAMERVLSDKELQRTLKLNCQEQKRKFSWDITAKETMSMYKL